MANLILHAPLGKWLFQWVHLASYYHESKRQSSGVYIMAAAIYAKLSAFVCALVQSPYHFSKLSQRLWTHGCIDGSSCPVLLGGGVGPAASVQFQNILIANLTTDGTDQSHPHVFHASLPALVGDRTEFLRDRSRPNPGIAMAQVMHAQHLACRSLGMERAVGGVPCNTFHAPPIWEAYTNELRRLGSREVKTVNMIEATVQELQELAVRDGITRVGVMSTSGSRSQQLYRRPLEAAGLVVLEVPEEMQQEVHATIYDEKQGIKATGAPTPWAIDRFNGYADLLISNGAQVLVLGCSEIPLVLPGKEHRGVALVDPMVCLARELLRLSNPEKLLARDCESAEEVMTPCSPDKLVKATTGLMSSSSLSTRMTDGMSSGSSLRSSSSTTSLSSLQCQVDVEACTCKAMLLDEQVSEPSLMSSPRNVFPPEDNANYCAS